MIVPANEDTIGAAAAKLRNGELIGMPTETVYGVAANALDLAAVKATFEAKGRPSENPLIVHVASMDQVREVAREVPESARQLAEKFWPGPLTMVLNKQPIVPDEVTADLPTVAVRMPAHPVAKRLIELAGMPLSAPSANLFMGVSPTTAQMIAPALADKLAMILDGGPCEVGIESTIVDLSTERPIVLRLGMITPEALEAVLGTPVLVGDDDGIRAPGMYPRHYAPRARVHIIGRLEPDQPGLVLGEGSPGQIVMPINARDYARELYKSLAELDGRGLDAIFVEAPPVDLEWQAVWDRLRKAAGET
ncbi:MAG: L-threonylcarbamoyladenylate synthase [Fimbriimonadaceae bacterium]|jgi:L-threonylcarbamoyladenylate synthase|nr:L-threonylcarbamoyladenylate synthase [Fimbriimonadaceae bacterium]